MTYKTIIYEVRDEIAILTFNRPEKRNAFDMTMREELANAVMVVRDDADLKAMLITGAGEAFCAGGDLQAITDDKMDARSGRRRIQNIHVWLPQLIGLEIPVVAAVDGPAYGAGFNLALACDFVLATPRARFCAVFGRIGLVPDAGGFFLLPRIVGLQRAKDLIFTARAVGAEEAERIGIVHEIHPPEVLLDRAIEFAGRFRASSRLAIGMAKTVLNQALHLDQHAIAEMEAWSQGIALDSDYHKTAVQRFLDKQPLEYDWDAAVKEGAAKEAVGKQAAADD